MAITNPAAITFVNEQIRVIADLLTQAYNLSVQIKNEWDSQGLSAIITDTSDVIEDSSHSGATTPDGRPAITGVEVNDIIDRVTDMITDLEATSNLKLTTLLKVAVNHNP